MDLETFGLIQTSIIIKTQKSILPAQNDNIHLSFINENLDDNNWDEIYQIWDKL